MKTVNETLTFDFEDRILSVVDNNVHIQTFNEKDEVCILLIPREKYIKAMSDWLDSKAEYWKNWGHYCGVGYVLVYDCVKKEKGILSIFNEDIGELGENEYFEVDIYSPQPDSEIIVDMEHG
jgi:hypothetical protein